MTSDDNSLKKIIAHAKEYGFVFPSSQIYDGFGATYDYGQHGVALKNNIKLYWWKWMTQLHKDIVGIDASIFMHPRVWKASGHTDAFNDPLVDNKDSKKRYRADVLIENVVATIETKIEKEIDKAAKRFGQSFDREMFTSTNERVLAHRKKAAEIRRRMKEAIETSDLKALKQLILDMDIADPISGSRNWTDVRQFNLMFSTQLGATEEASSVYLRPETAQGIFVNFLNVQKTGRMKIPFGIAQIGKAFRNEIIARQFIFRMREFEQMEMQFFVKPGEELAWYEYWKKARMQWHQALGFGTENYRFHDHLNLAHYANAACDIQFRFPMGFRELEGIHSRTDFDLKSHEAHSGKKLRYFDPDTGHSYIPYVVETSLGLDRMLLAVLAHAYYEDSALLRKEEESAHTGSRIVLRIPPELAPIKVGILPLVRKDGLPERAKKIVEDLKLDFTTYYEDKDTIGKRYRRMDAIGTPFCATIDNQTLQDETITVRYRDTMQQDRMTVSELKEKIRTSCSITTLLKKT